MAKKCFLMKLLLIGCLVGMANIELQAAKTKLPAPTYLSNPYFGRCKAKCPVINHGSWQELNMDCIYACIWFYESKEAVNKFFNRARRWLDEHIW